MAYFRTDMFNSAAHWKQTHAQYQVTHLTTPMAHGIALVLLMDLIYLSSQKITEYILLHKTGLM